MNLLDHLDCLLEEKHLLKHSFYKEFNAGGISKEKLCLYAEEYYHHVAAFPRYISQIHALCPDIKSRQVLLDNLIDEEKGEDNHPELWLRFLRGLGSSEKNIKEKPRLPATSALVDGFFDLVREDYAIGLGALYAYERQTPEISESKITALKEEYCVTDERTLEFFSVHGKIDVWHTEEVRSLIKKLNEKGFKKTSVGALKGAELLWDFLSGIEAYADHKNTDA